PLVGGPLAGSEPGRRGFGWYVRWSSATGRYARQIAVQRSSGGQASSPARAACRLAIEIHSRYPNAARRAVISASARSSRGATSGAAALAVERVVPEPTHVGSEPRSELMSSACPPATSISSL